MTIPHPLDDADAHTDIVLLWQLLGYEVPQVISL
jgi:hypothetical protein